MRIGISTSVVQRGRGGVGQYLLALLRALSAHPSSHAYTLFVLEDDRPLFAFAEPAMRVEVVSERYRPPARDLWWHQCILPDIARRLGLDVLHVPSYRRMLWRRPCSLVATIHDLAPFRLAGKYDWKRMLYGRLVVPWLAHRQDQIIAVSRATARDITSYLRVHPSRLTVIPNGLDHRRFTAEADPDEARDWAARRGIQPPFFLYVARLEHPAKNHARLIAAFNGFKTNSPSPWQLVLIGSDWHGAETIHDLVHRSPFAQDIRCLGFVSDAELPIWYRAASAFVYPSLCEGFGMPPLEAMACGCPVLISNDDALAEVCGDAALQVEPREIESLQHQLTRLATDSALRDRLRSAGFARARQFSWDQTAARTLEIYARAAGCQRAPFLTAAAHPVR